MNSKIFNPVLTGFNPDPSILYAKGKYYIATSTFEYCPGVQISCSTDLANWKVVARPVTHDKEDRRGIEQGGGVWAPCLTYDGKKFYLVYSRVTSWSVEPFKDVDNFLITADDIEGEWSDPVYLNSDGFDASLYHEGDKAYYVSVVWDFRKPVGAPQFSGILCREFDKKTMKFVGDGKIVFKGTDRGLVEAPHIYKVGEYYYLFTAEGGTDEEHAETVARSKNVFGPYELHPLKHIISSYKTDNPLQKAGHASICQGGDGNWYMAHLCGRKLFDGNCVLGRETAIQNIVFKEDGWPYLSHGGTEPRAYFEVPYPVEVNKDKGGVIPFNDYTLKNVYQSLRAPLGDRLKVLNEHTVELTGGETIVSRFEQSGLFVRQTDAAFEAQVKIDFSPEKFSHMAGLLYRYEEGNQYLIYMSKGDDGYNELSVFSYVKRAFKYSPLNVKVGESVWLKVVADTEKARFYYSKDGVEFIPAWEEFGVSNLSDEEAYPMGFTGAFVGFYAADLSEKKKTARFTDFAYFKK